MVLDPDTKLMLDFAKGDISAFEQVISKYKGLVINVAYRYLQNRSEAEDIAQEVFIRIFKSGNSYRPKAKLSTWIYKITSNLCLNQLRSQKRVKVISMETIGEVSDSDQNDPIDNLEKAKLKQLVKESINSLPDRQRMAVILQRYEGLSYQEISEIIGCSISAVDSLLQRAKQNLKNKLAPFFKENSEVF